MNYLKIMPLASIVTAMLVVTANADIASKEQAHRIADNWINTIIYYTGSWGGEAKAEVASVQEFRRDERLLGYLCEIHPRGFILVSLYEGLAPVKSFSPSSNLEYESDEGPVGLLKDSMSGILDSLQARTGNLGSAMVELIRTNVDIDYFPAWEWLDQDPILFSSNLLSDDGRSNYLSGDSLLSSAWHQGDPYYRQCPAPPQGSTCTEPHCAVGCVATAMAQIMRYWAWPPSDVYFLGQWYLMPDQLFATSDEAQINAVALLCATLGAAVNMEYCRNGDCGSGAYIEDAVPALKTYFAYHEYGSILYSGSFTEDEWWNYIQIEHNSNRPILYEIPRHALVCDGWKELVSPPMRMLHMNYGWGDTSTNIWYTLDAVWDITLKMVINMLPAVAMGSSVTGVYPPFEQYQYRYFDVDCAATGATTFEAGQSLQFLPDVVLSCTSGSIRIESSDVIQTKLFSNGDTRRGALLAGGTIKVLPGGNIKFSRLIGL